VQYFNTLYTIKGTNRQYIQSNNAVLIYLPPSTRTNGAKENLLASSVIDFITDANIKIWKSLTNEHIVRVRTIEFREISFDLPSLVLHSSNINWTKMEVVLSQNSRDFESIWHIRLHLYSFEYRKSPKKFLTPSSLPRHVKKTRWHSLIWIAYYEL
jgi:hypothetical protein